MDKSTVKEGDLVSVVRVQNDPMPDGTYRVTCSTENGIIVGMHMPDSYAIFMQVVQRVEIHHHVALKCEAA